MQITRIRALRGPNVWTRHTAIEVLATLDEAEQSLAGLPGFEVRLRARFPEVGDISDGDEAVSLLHALARTALGLQARAGCPVTFAQVRPTSEPGVSYAAIEYTEEAVGRRALALAEQLCVAARDDQPFDLPAALAELRDLDEDLRLGPSTGSIVDAAVARGIPYRRLTEGSLVQLGWGSKRRRIQAAEIDASSAIAESIAQDKDLTKRLLHNAGVPVPEGRPVDSVDEAFAFMQSLGAPLVVKPRDGNQGNGITVNVQTREQLETAFLAAREHSSDILVERYLPGHDYRLLVIGNQLCAAARRDPPHVTGDGVSTIQQLVALVNQDPRRGDGHATSLTRIRLDDIARTTLARQGLTVNSVPDNGVRVVLRNNANLSTGGSATDVTDEVHPEVAQRAVEAARAVGLDICGIDVVVRSIQRPLEAQGGGIVEVNAAPGLRMHLSPSFGRSRPIGASVIDSMYSAGENGRIPVVAVTGVNGKTTTVRLIAHLFKHIGKRVGLTTTDGVYANDRLIDTGDCSGPRSARSVLMHPEVDAAVFETARGGLLREGLAFDRCQVAVVTNIGAGDHLGLNHIDTVEQLARLKQVVVQSVADTGYAVLNADDPLTVAMAESCPGQVIFFGMDAGGVVLARQLAKGGRVVYRDGDVIIAVDRQTRHRFPLAGIPMTIDGSVPFQVYNAMAGIAAAWALGMTWQQISHGMATFVTDSRSAPGRFNQFDYRGARIIADYGHNPDAIASLSTALANMPARRRLVVISGAGDRRDEDLRRQTEILGAVFDEVLLYEDACQRGRQDGEVMAIMRQGLTDAARTRHIDEIRGEFIAIDTALQRLQPGDLCLILIDQIDEALAHIDARCREARALATAVAD